MREWDAQGMKTGDIRAAGDEELNRAFRRRLDSMPMASPQREPAEIPTLLGQLEESLRQMAAEIDALEKAYSPVMTPQEERPGTVCHAPKSATRIGSELADRLQVISSLNERLRGFAARCQL